MMNRFYDGGGFGHLFGVDGLFLLNQNWRLSFELFKNTNQEPVQDWITTTAEIRGKTIALDGIASMAMPFTFSYIEKPNFGAAIFTIETFPPNTEPTWVLP